MTPELLCLSTADRYAEPRTNKQHLTSRLPDGGTRVIHVHPLGLRTPSADPRDLHRILHQSRVWRPAAAAAPSEALASPHEGQA